MQVFSTVRELTEFLDTLMKAEKRIGFVPTMGALHSGHLSLIEKSSSENDITVCSIFVNPTQFNNPSDLANYPRTLERDTTLLQTVACDVLFAPSVAEMYPKDEVFSFQNIDFKGIDSVMEGKYRKGHFTGVVQVVKRLFDIVIPTNAYFGEKDYQQLAIIRRMAQSLNLPVKIIGCAIVREFDGLAMSSRNARLSEKERENAALIYKTLLVAKKNVQKTTVEELKKWVTEVLNTNTFLRVEYVEVADSATLLSIDEWQQSSSRRLFVAVFVGEIRLIDNIVL